MPPRLETTCLRVDSALLERADRLVPLYRAALRHGIVPPPARAASRSDVLRAAMEAGLLVIEERIAALPQEDNP